ncbi:MAG TPA: hypothetical protein VIL49_08160 [Capillimicrobium sp.]|jgi:hypothetical protein
MRKLAILTALAAMLAAPAAAQAASQLVRVHLYGVHRDAGSIAYHAEDDDCYAYRGSAEDALEVRFKSTKPILMRIQGSRRAASLSYADPRNTELMVGGTGTSTGSHSVMTNACKYDNSGLIWERDEPEETTDCGGMEFDSYIGEIRYSGGKMSAVIGPGLAPLANVWDAASCSRPSDVDIDIAEAKVPASRLWGKDERTFTLRRHETYESQDESSSEKGMTRTTIYVVFRPLKR